MRDLYGKRHRSARIMHEAIKRARTLGHRMPPAEQDIEPGAMFSRCQSCGLYACVDIADSPEPFGGAIERRCGRRMR